jgi:glycosyltransferase involved in cell wall biosynthesis
VEPRVSVIMPFLDSARFIAESVESVRAQTYQAWELLLCDDGSSDASTEIARRFAAADPERIRWAEHEGHANRGASAARNLGLSLARGDYVAFLDADDVWLPRKLEEQVALLDATPADVLCGSTEFWYGWTGQATDAALDHTVRIGPPHGSIVPPPELLRRMLLGTIAVPCTCSLIARRDAVRRVGGFEESFRKVYTDQSFYAKLFLHSPVLIVDDTWDRYRQQPDSSCAVADRTGELAAARIEYVRWVDRYLDQCGVAHPGLRAALRRATWRAKHPRAAAAAARWRRALRRLGVMVRPRGASDRVR